MCLCPLIKQGCVKNKNPDKDNPFTALSGLSEFTNLSSLINMQALIFVSYRSSLEFLATYLQLYTLPEKFQPVSPLGIAEPNIASYPLRHQLFNWLIPINEEGDSTNEPLAFWTSRTTSRYFMGF